ncbi:MAG: hypothetical protein WCA08_22845, partial [Desulfoferrobacter sp.]
MNSQNSALNFEVFATACYYIGMDFERVGEISQVETIASQQFSFWLGACPIIGRMVSIVIPASFKPESRPAPKKDFRIMDSGL